MRIQWTRETVAEISAGFKTRAEMRVSVPRALAAARWNGWEDVLPPPAHLPWTVERLIAAAADCKTTSEVQKRYAGAYEFASRKGLRHLLPSVDLGDWTSKTAVAGAAAECKGRAEFLRRFRGAYAAARKNGWMDDVLPKKKADHDNDCFYVWHAEGVLFNGLPVYKVGLTSCRLGKRRMQEVALGFGVTPVLILRVSTPEAVELEAFALALGANPKLGKSTTSSGHTEFRAYTPSELERIVDFAQQSDRKFFTPSAERI